MKNRNSTIIILYWTNKKENSCEMINVCVQYHSKHSIRTTITQMSDYIKKNSRQIEMDVKQNEKSNSNQNEISVFFLLQKSPNEIFSIQTIK